MRRSPRVCCATPPGEWLMGSSGAKICRLYLHMAKTLSPPQAMEFLGGACFDVFPSFLAFSYFEVRELQPTQGQARSARRYDSIQLRTSIVFSQT